MSGHYRKVRLVLLLMCCSLPGVGLYGQLSGSNGMEFQLGNIPFSDPAYLTSHYNQLNLGYRQDHIKLFLRAEVYLNQLKERSYKDFTQYRFEYRKNGFQFVAGNFYHMLGNGLLLRSYEIPGNIFEDQGFRIKHGFYRDIEGFMAGYSGKNFTVRGMRGKVLINQLPPTIKNSDRRIDLLESLEGEYRFLGQNVGLIWMRTQREGSLNNYSSILMEGLLPLELSYKMEYSQKIGPGSRPFNINEDLSYAFYGNLSFAVSNFGGLFEIKKYNEYVLGAGYNDPPGLVKEHSSRVLNRSTHIPQISNESGIQLELYYFFPGGMTLTFNTARAINQIIDRDLFSEYYLEIYTPVGRGGDIKVFADYAEDQFRSEYNRISTGVQWEKTLSGSWGASGDIEFQTFERRIVGKERVNNGVATLGFNKLNRFSVEVIWEFSTDPFLVDHPNTFEVETGKRQWWGIQFGHRFDGHHNIQLFAGQRRGGPACASGICYEVLDFEGIEIKLTSKF